MSAELLKKIADEVADCTKCRLCKGRTHTVPGEGSPEAKILFIGEAPGYHEDLQGRPFVGPSGQLLDKMLKALKMSRDDVFIANVVKCRPPDNRDPQDDEITACKNYLDRQIAAINPRLIITLGRFSMRRWWPNERISQVHGKPKTENGRIIMPMFHPAAALRDRERTYQLFREDAFTIPSLLEQAEELALKELWSVPVQPEEPVTTTPQVEIKKVEKETLSVPDTRAIAEETLPFVVAEADTGSEEKSRLSKPRKKKPGDSQAEQLTLF
jgi:DNA polymerase